MKLRVSRRKTVNDGVTVFTPETRAKKNTGAYGCSICQYQSNRQYNVSRHEDRIHGIIEKPRICCGTSFITKGEYYLHCEQIHPETRPNAITSRLKYKITSDSVITSLKSHRCSETSRDATAYNLRLRRRYSERIRTKEEGKMKSKLSVKYSVTYREYDIENIPLISFLTDRRLKSYLKELTSSKITKETKNEIAKESNQTLKISVSSEQNIEKAVSQNGEETVQAKVSDSSVSSFSVELPTKKLILHRFRTNVKHEFEIALHETNNNDRNQVNFAEKQSRELTSVHQTRSKNYKRFSKADKENVSKFSISLEQQLKINLDSGITVPLVTQLHRDFLGSIDFDAYKLF